MLRFIWQNWWRHKERFILLLVGALIVSSGLSYLVGLSQSNKGTVEQTLAKHWSASYDIVVRPPDSRSTTEVNHLLEPNYLSGIDGGISVAQYKKIKEIEGVDVAAPIAMIGYIRMGFKFPKKFRLSESGLYKYSEKEVTDNGVNKKIDTSTFFFPVGTFDPYIRDEKHPFEYGVIAYNGDLSLVSSLLIAGIDPEQEAKLVGLDKSILNQGYSRYFSAADKSIIRTENIDSIGDLKAFTRTIPEIPIIVSNQPRVKKSVTYKIQALDVPFDTEKKANRTMEKVKKNGGVKYLKTLPLNEKGPKYEFTFSPEQVYKTMMKEVAGIDFDSNKIGMASISNNYLAISDKPSMLGYKKIKSPFPTKWPYAFDLKTYKEPYLKTNIFRPYNGFIVDYGGGEEWISVDTKWIGTYDPSKLNVPQDPLTELPMETYRPATAQLVLDADKKPVNPPKSLLPTDGAYDLLSQPPSVLTTIDAAEKIMGKKPISAIRIKVAGVKTLNDKSQQKLERIAKEIRDKTGLITDITLGSSPQSVLTHVPAINDQKEMGWIEMPWVNIGSAYTIYHETQVGFSGIIASVMAVAIVYVLASGLVTLYARRKEFAVLLAIGWRPNQITKLLFLESTILGSFVAIVAWLILGWVLLMKGAETSILRFVLAGLFGLVIYWLGAIGPAYLSRRISPYEAMRTGEISTTAHRFIKSKGSISMSFNHFLGKWKRSILSVVAMALPTALLSLFLFITFKLKGVMYTSWLGEFVAMQIGTSHYIAMGVAFAIAILTTAEIMWQNISERIPEIALLKAVGWQNFSIRMLIYREGLLNGIIAGILGLVLSFLIMLGMYKEFPTEQISFFLATGLIPVFAGLLGVMIPAERAVHIQPAQGVLNSLSNKRRTEIWFKGVLAVLSILLVTGLVMVTIRLMS
ncbi:ABC transporter permease [Bacillus sp. APMAM]|nr:ABC transporter permease [Bacillus sp. APMAM]RTZ57697.1 FtsX-like permease family protein [Bacillus sp. SAJ1]